MFFRMITSFLLSLLMYFPNFELVVYQYYIRKYCKVRRSVITLYQTKLWYFAGFVTRVEIIFDWNCVRYFIVAVCKKLSFLRCKNIVCFENIFWNVWRLVVLLYEANLSYRRITVIIEIYDLLGLGGETR